MILALALSMLVNLAGIWALWRTWAWGCRAFNFGRELGSHEGRAEGFEQGRWTQLQANLRQLEELHASVMSTRASVLFKRGTERKA